MESHTNKQNMPPVKRKRTPFKPGEGEGTIMKLKGGNQEQLRIDVLEYARLYAVAPTTLAKLVGISHPTLLRFLIQDKRIRWDVFYKISRFLSEKTNRKID